MHRIQIGAALWLFSTATVLGFPAGRSKDNCVEAPPPFESQYQEAFRAYKTGDDQAVKAALESFRIPASWFAEMFGADKAPEVEAQYADEFEYFEWHTLSEFHSIDKAEKTTIKTVTCGGSSPNPPPKPAPASLRPLPEAKMFRTSYSKKHQRFEGFESEMWASLYAEVDGHVWFFGSGGYPFWDPVGHADMCAKPGEQTTHGKLITRVEPEYPESAKGKHVGGVVRARLTVAKDGTISEAEIMTGDPLLADAAKKAFLQWRYTPFMNCGQPTEKRIVGQVTFTPPS
ncbi:MAG: energy transducer TonB [Candidatus Sulfotelmatobacter sp.]